MVNKYDDNDDDDDDEQYWEKRTLPPRRSEIGTVSLPPALPALCRHCVVTACVSRTVPSLAFQLHISVN